MNKEGKEFVKILLSLNMQTQSPLHDRDVGGAGLIGDQPHFRPIRAGMGPGLMGYGAGTGIKFIWG